MVKRLKRFGRLSPVLGMAVVASLVVSGLAVSSASAAEEHWYLCQKVNAGEGQYSSGCHSHAIGGEYELVRQTEGTSLPIASNKTTPIKLSYKIGTATYTIECKYSQSSGSSSVLNPNGGGAGTIAGSPALLTLGECQYNPGFGTCTVLEGKVRAYESVGATSGQSVSFKASGGTTLFSFETSCSGKFEITGTLTGTFDNATNTLVFDSSSGSGLKMSGNPVWIEGAIKLTTPLTAGLKPLFLQ
jgi:hypothetical protein